MRNLYGNNVTSLWEKFWLDNPKERIEEWIQDEKSKYEVAWQDFEAHVLKPTESPRHFETYWQLGPDRQQVFRNFVVSSMEYYGLRPWLDSKFENYLEAIESRADLE